ncbi:acyltransferase family protein [Curtobacterium sp. RIT-PI-V]|uniref:acyltransferase family protein n=1 Tax=Curtobacterium sp. RIT-PI-V TaxID=3035296 RepID=UPI0021D91CAD|nr:acyltransferase [Curtobacterium sp. RIT-PI-V]
MPTRTSPRSLAAAFDPRRNALNAIRLVLASAVILAHAWPMGGWSGEPSAGGLSIGDWAVGAFFAISGFLITRSRMRTALTDFVLRRFLRIYPAYITVTLVIAFGFAPVAVLAFGEASWSVWASVSFVLRNLFLKIMQDDIPGTIEDVPLPGVWNGSFWTLGYEFACYLVIGVLVAVLRRRSLLIGGVLLGMALSGGAALALAADVISVPTALGVAFRPTAFFFGGAFVFLVADRLPARAWFAGAMALVLVAGAGTGFTVLVAPVPLAVLCVLAGAWLRGDRLTARHDVSYGVYLYGWPVGQMIAHVLVRPTAEPWVIAGVTILGSIPFAIASWLLVERPAMRLAAPLRRRSDVAPAGLPASSSTRDCQRFDARPLPSQRETEQLRETEQPRRAELLRGTDRPRGARHRRPDAPAGPAASGGPGAPGTHTMSGKRGAGDAARPSRPAGPPSGTRD